MTLVEDTLRGIANEKRAIPIALVCLPMTWLESRFAGVRGVILALIIFGGFLAIGPICYRALLPLRGNVRHRLARVLAFGVVAIAYVVLFGVVVPRLLGVSRSILTDSITLYSAAPLFWAGSWALGRDLDWEASLRSAEVRNAELLREAERAQLLALRSHLDPHFLFNTLNAIAEWCRDDPAVAERATLQLSKMLRTILGGVKTNACPLGDELELVEQLLDLHRTRDPQRFTFELEVAPEARAIAVPPLLLLSLVENAVKHGPAAGHAGRIELCARVDAEQSRLRVTLRNPGPFRGPREGGEGLPTLEKRLQLAYAGAAEMHHTSDEHTTTATLVLPLKMKADAV
jgi:two-component system, LytTR family, sensor histidine kinase AlgZ